MAHRTKRPDKRRRYSFRMINEPHGASALEIAINRAAKLLEHERVKVIGPVMAAFELFRRGYGSDTHWAALADAMNVGLELAERHQIASNHRGTFDAGKNALVAVMDRQQQTGSWTLRGAEIGDLELATFVHKVQIQECSRGELSKAVTTVVARYRGALAGNASPGTRIMAARPAMATEAAGVPA